MSAKVTMLSVAAVAIVGGILAGMILSRKPSPVQLPTPEINEPVKLVAVETTPTAQAQEVAPAEPGLSSVETAPVIETAKPGANAKPAQNNPSPANTGKKPRQLVDPAAREALALVGFDRDAEAYWLEAIYDASLPDNEREDLMEDLNEDGLSDPKNPGPQDLPLIISRLALIEEIVPHADEFMLRHLGEAYKDLINLADRTQGGGQPVR